MMFIAVARQVLPANQKLNRFDAAHFKGANGGWATYSASTVLSR